VHPTSGSRRVFWQFSAPQRDSAFELYLRPAHLRLTLAVSPQTKVMDNEKALSFV